uniref:Glutathione S-transferase n=1 Tax=Alexandrium andersonii TaxID=327968 RepID=A0A7S2J540_9DINO
MAQASGVGSGTCRRSHRVVLRRPRGTYTAAVAPQLLEGVVELKANGMAMARKANKPTMSVEIYGMEISGNVIPPVLFAMDKKCGKFVRKDMMKGELKTQEFLKINPWGQMPAMQDGKFCLAEGNAILRYLANKYCPSAYGGSDLKSKAMIDWALDWANTNFMKQYAGIWYPTVGFGSPPEDQKAVNDACTENLNKFAKLFLATTKFVGGDSPSIADYKCAVLFWYLDFPAIRQQRAGFELPERIKAYVKDFMDTCESKDFLSGGSGFMASKATN